MLQRKNLMDFKYYYFFPRVMYNFKLLDLELENLHAKQFFIILALDFLNFCIAIKVLVLF